LEVKRGERKEERGERKDVVVIIILTKLKKTCETK